MTHLPPDPKDGDFVAYLEKIEQLQLANARRAAASGAAAIPVPPAEVFTKSSAASVAHKGSSALVGGAIAAMIGAFFALAGLFGAHVVPLLIGVGLLWFGTQRVRRALREATPGSAALARAMVENLRAANTRRST